MYGTKNFKTSDWSAFHQWIIYAHRFNPSQKLINFRISFTFLLFSPKTKNSFLHFKKIDVYLFEQMIASKESQSPRQRNVHTVCRMTKRRCGRLLQVRSLMKYKLWIITQQEMKIILRKSNQYLKRRLSILDKDRLTSQSRKNA